MHPAWVSAISDNAQALIQHTILNIGYPEDVVKNGVGFGVTLAENRYFSEGKTILQDYDVHLRTLWCLLLGRDSAAHR